jgi:hypothetical protein
VPMTTASRCGPDDDSHQGRTKEHHDQGVAELSQDPRVHGYRFGGGHLVSAALSQPPLGFGLRQT